MILLTGGTGLVGSRILFDLASSGKSIRAIRRAKSNLLNVNRWFSARPELLPSVEWVEGDVTDIFSIEDALEGIDTVFHAAAHVSFDPSDKEKMMKVNAEGTANMVNTALKQKVKRFCHVSSTAALGRAPGGQTLDENSWWKTSKENTNYAISKYCGEREVWRGMEEGLDAFIINPSVVIGPGNWKSGSSQMFTRIWSGMPFYSEGLTGFVDVRDVSKAALTLMEKGVKNERYIINAENVSYRYVFDRIAEGLGKKKATLRVSPAWGEIGWRLVKIASWFSRSHPMITRETARSGFMQWRYSNEKIIRETGMHFISVKDSVNDACRFFLDDINAG
jgi:nucleoside-diphosphate-sugar epimerase